MTTWHVYDDCLCIYRDGELVAEIPRSAYVRVAADMLGVLKRFDVNRTGFR